MKFYYNNEGEVKMYSEGYLDCPNFYCVEIEPAADEMDKIIQNYKIYFRNGQLEFIEPKHKADERKYETLEKLKKEASSLKDKDTKALVEKILDVITI